MGLQYTHLSEIERYLIEQGRASGLSFTAIGRLLRRSASTVMRESRRGHWAPFGRYLAVFGERHYAAARRNAGLLRRKLGADLNSPLWQHVRRGLALGWSPQQIAGRMRLADPLHGVLPGGPPYVSHETMYSAIYGLPRSPQRTEMIKLLRQSRSGRRRRARGKQRFVGLQHFTSIALRPVEVASRQHPGHWEGDIVEGARGTLPVVASVVERTSRLVRLVKLCNGSADVLLGALTERLGAEPPCMRRSLTYDRGTEMARHRELASALGMDIYICDAYKPWQRGTNENTNGLVRQYLPKGTDLTHVTQDQLALIEQLLNNRPRRVLGYRTPQEVYDRMLALHDAH